MRDQWAILSQCYCFPSEKKITLSNTNVKEKPNQKYKIIILVQAWAVFVGFGLSSDEWSLARALYFFISLIVIECFFYIKGVSCITAHIVIAIFNIVITYRATLNVLLIIHTGYSYITKILPQDTNWTDTQPNREIYYIQLNIDYSTSLSKFYSIKLCFNKC